MKIPAFLSKLSELVFRPIFWFGRLLAKIWAAIFGRISWTAPTWLSRTNTAWSNFGNARPWTNASIVMAVLLIVCGSIWGWKWYQSRPKPHRVSANVSTIPVTKLDKELQYPPLIIKFSDPAARLEDLKKPSLTGVKLEPSIPGTWSWNSDRELAFHPTEDWPADKKFEIIFDKQFFPSQVLMERLTYETRTPAFSLTISQPELYQDPSDPKQRQVTATIELTHQVEPGQLEKHIKLTMVGGSAVFPPSEQPPHFTVTYGLHRRVAYLRSSNVALPEKEDFMKVEVSSGVRTAQGGAETRDSAEQKISIPSAATAFQISSIDGNIARTKNGEPEQVLILSTTADISTKDLAKAVKIWLLPKREAEKSDDENSDTDSESAEKSDNDNQPSDSEDSEETSESKQEAAKWQSATDVPDEILQKAKPIQFTALPSEKAQDRQHAFRVKVETEGELYVRVAHGVKAFGDYPLAEDYNAVVAVPELPREVQIESQGGLLALNGERKLSIRSRGLNAIEYEVARVGTTQINHLVSQTSGKFEDPEFKDPQLFNQENISRISIQHQPIAVQDKWKANYSAYDFTEQLKKPADGGSERGLFFVTARGWDPEKKKPISDIKDSRFLLITDIGILIKKGSNGGSDVFLVSIKSGKPIADATVDILGKNGIPIQTAKTAADGHCGFSSVEKSEREKSPTAFVARSGDDVAFIPFASEDRVLNFSRFEIEGAENIGPDGLDAFVFTERGVYRPGDEIHAGVIVKQRNWQGNLKGLPVETEVVDARDLKVQTKKVTLPESGFVELSYLTANESPTGTYTINVYLIKDNKRGTLLGSTTTSVKEFLPDRMKLETRLSKAVPKGWISPNDVHATVTLANLYGTPASDRRVTGKVELEPSEFTFSEFRDYTFFDPLLDEKKTRSSQTSDLGEQKTDNDGHADFDLQLERFADSTYAMRFIAEGFEGEGGRSVTSYVNALVSALPYVIGYKPDGDLRYIDMKKPRAVDLIAIDPQLNKIAVENVTLNLVAQEYVSVLKKQENGNYAYESVLRERPLKSEKIAVAATGLHYALPTNDPGDYVLELRDDKNRLVSKLRFSVVGQGEASRSLEKNAELQIKLDKKQYNPGEDIAVSIIAPYAG
ncbi:MAG TPA: MG2 domain-containing protein, partial [Chthoniobacterales bacterium]|nr:MG2 domain-containing protein [Chthoniobacterales bacterium]